jgi:hypothetical protein
VHTEAINHLISLGHSQEAIDEAVKHSNVLNVKQNQIYTEYKEYINKSVNK